LKKTIPHYKVTDMRQPAFGVQEHKVQLVMPNGFVVPLYDTDCLRFLGWVHRINLAKRIPGRFQ
jgi:hypothetical protein